MIISLMAENLAEQTPTVEELSGWAGGGANHPVVIDANWEVTYRYTSGTISLPSMHLIGPGMEIKAVQTTFSRSEIEAQLSSH